MGSSWATGSIFSVRWSISSPSTWGQFNFKMLRLGLFALAAAEEPSVRAGWQDGFKAYAQAVMKDTTGLCDTLTKCVGSMENYFRKYIQDDFTNSYVTIGWCAEP